MRFPVESVANPASLGLAEFTRSGLIIPELRQRDTAGIIWELSQAMQREGCLPDMLPLYHAALNQELLSSNSLECGIALPHARLSVVRQMQFAFGRLHAPVTWGTSGPARVQFVFLVAIPATDATTYLQLLAGIARLGNRPHVLAQLRAAVTSSDVLRLLEGVPISESA